MNRRLGFLIFVQAVLGGCSIGENRLEEQVLDSLQERIGAGSPGISIDSVCLEKSGGAIFVGTVYLSAGSLREQDSVRVKSDLSGLEYEFPKPGPLLTGALP